MYGAYDAKPKFSGPLSTSFVADGLSSLDALLEALDNLDNLCVTVENAYHSSLANDSYEKWVERS